MSDTADTADTASFKFPFFEPDALPLADVFPFDVRDAHRQRGLPDAIGVDLNDEDPAYVCLWVGSQAEPGVIVDMRPAEALELAGRLRVCAEAAVQYAALYPPPAEADQGAGGR